MDFRVLALLTVAAVFMAFGFLVYFSGPRAVVNLVYCVFIASMVLWAVSLATFLALDDPAVTMLSARVTYLAGSLMACAFLHLSYVFPFGSFRARQLLCYVPLVILTVLYCFTPWLLCGFTYVDGTKGYLYGPLRPWWDAHFTGTFGVSFYRFLKAQAAHTGVTRMRIRYVMWTTLASFILAGTTNVFMPWFNRFGLIWLGPPLTLTWLFLIVYAITRYRLLDIRVAVLRTTLFVSLEALAIGAPLVLAASGRAQLTALFGEGWWMAPFWLMAFLSSLVPILYRTFQKQAEARIFRAERSYQAALHAISQELAGFTEVESLCRSVGRYVGDRMGLVWADLLIPGGGPSGGGRLPPDVTDALERWPGTHAKRHAYILAEEITAGLAGADIRALRAWIARTGASVIVPGLLREELVCCLALGPKRSGTIFNPDDFEVLEALARHSSLIIKNLELLEKVHEQQRLADLGELTTAINHEFNNIFTILSGTLQLTAMKLNDPALRQTVAGLQEDIRRGQYIVRAAAAYRTNRDTLLQPWPLGAIVADALTQARQDGFASAKPRFTVSLAVPQELTVVGRATIPELVHNALRCLGWACEGKPGTLRIDAAEEPSLVQLRVAMSGGEDLRATTEKAGALAPEPGRHGGLYYFLVKLIVADHRGGLTIESTVGGGTTLIVRLPKAGIN